MARPPERDGFGAIQELLEPGTISRRDIGVVNQLAHKWTREWDESRG